MSNKPTSIISIGILGIFFAWGNIGSVGLSGVFIAALCIIASIGLLASKNNWARMLFMITGGVNVIINFILIILSFTNSGNGGGIMGLFLPLFLASIIFYLIAFVLLNTKKVKEYYK